MKKTIIIFGNDNSINDFDFEYLKRLNDVVSIGINRVWMKTSELDYLFFLDSPILEELDEYKIKLTKTKLYTTNYLRRSITKSKKTNLLKTFSIHCYSKRIIRIGRTPNSVIQCVQLFNDHVFKEYECCFYVYGVSLDSSIPHFWWENKNIKNKTSEKWNEKRFNFNLESFKILKKKHYNIISLSKNSRLNQIFDFVDVNTFIKNYCELS